MNPRAGLGVLFLSMVGTAGDAQPPSPAPSPKPRIVALPWLVIDRNSGQEASRLEGEHPKAAAEGRQLAQSAQAALDAVLERGKALQYVPRGQWEPRWSAMKPDQSLQRGPGCASCGAADELIRFDREAVRQIAEAVQAEHVLLGATVVPLVWETTLGKPEPKKAVTSTETAACREAESRDPALARSVLMLVRAKDGQIVWKGDSRWPHDLRSPSSVKVKVGPRFGGGLKTIGASPTSTVAPPSPQAARERAVDLTAHSLGDAFRKEAKELLHVD